MDSIGLQARGACLAAGRAVRAGRRARLMPMEPILLTGIILITLILFITRILPIALTSIFIIAALALTGILEPHEALQGFSSTATITVAAMLILSAGLMRTGALEFLRRSLSNYCELSLPRLLLAFALVVALSSAFMNNTPVVVIMIPVIMTACRRTRLQASKLLIPVSYFSILGGTCTLIGTGTNLLIDDLFRRAGGPGFHVFDFTSVGLVYLVVGAAVVILLAPRTARRDLRHRGRSAARQPPDRTERRGGLLRGRLCATARVDPQ